MQADVRNQRKLFIHPMQVDDLCMHAGDVRADPCSSNSLEENRLLLPLRASRTVPEVKWEMWEKPHVNDHMFCSLWTRVRLVLTNKLQPFTVLYFDHAKYYWSSPCSGQKYFMSEGRYQRQNQCDRGELKQLHSGTPHTGFAFMNMRTWRTFDPATHTSYIIHIVEWWSYCFLVCSTTVLAC